MIQIQVGEKVWRFWKAYLNMPEQGASGAKVLTTGLQELKQMAIVQGKGVMLGLLARWLDLSSQV